MKDALEQIGEIIIKAVGEDPEREGLVKTPQRFAKALRDITAGYQGTPERIIGDGVFSSESIDPVVVARMKLYSICGECSVAYIPAGKIIGLSKIPRIVDLYAKRLQVQENLTEQIGWAIEQAIKPAGIAVMISATHLCSVMRNLQDYDAPMITTYRRGVYRENESLFESFQRLAGHGAKR